MAVGPCALKISVALPRPRFFDALLELHDAVSIHCVVNNVGKARGNDQANRRTFHVADVAKVTL